MDRDLPLSVKPSLARPRQWLHALALALLAAAGCYPDLVGLPCVVDDNCPTGQFCDQRQCYPPRNGSTDGGSATDGGEAVDGGVAIDGGSSDDGGSGDGGGSPADGGPLDDGGAATDAGLTSLDGGEDAGGFPQPPGTIAVNFTVDDTANRLFTAGDGGASSLRWYGNLAFDASTRELSYDNGWSGPYPALYDDGPWIRGGHEPSSNVAGDHRWGATVFVKVPTTAAVAFEYGAVDAATNGWLWRGQNGEFTVEVGATQPITVASLTLLKFGSTDLMLVLDTNSLEPHPPAFDGGVSPWSLSSVKVKGTAWAWTQAPMEDDGGIDASPGDGKYTFVLSQVVGPGKIAPHSGLLASGDVTDFVFLLGSEEYRISGEASIQGATAFLKADGGSFSPVAISHSGGVQNPRVLVP